MGKVKQIDIKNRTYYFYNNIFNLKNFESNLLEIDKKHYQGIIFTILHTLELKTLVTVKIFTL